jgi:NADH-quinone oxidoreductase subunit J
VIVYAGAVVVLFLFVIMLLGSDAQTPPDERGRFARYGAAALFSGLGLAALTLLWRTMALPKPPARAPETLGTIEAVGKAIFTETLVPFELSSALLIVAVVGAIAVARGRHGDLVATKGVKGAAAIEKDEALGRAKAVAKVGAVEISAAEKGAHA